jgi:hypothetical protein
LEKWTGYAKTEMGHVLIVRRVPLDVSIDLVHESIGTWTDHTIAYSTWMSSTLLPCYKTKQAYINFKSLDHAWTALDMLSNECRTINNAELLFSDPEPRRTVVSRAALRFNPAKRPTQQVNTPDLPEPPAVPPITLEPEASQAILRPTPVYMQPNPKYCIELNIDAGGELFWEAYRAGTEPTCRIIQQCNHRAVINTQEATVTFFGSNPSFDILIPILHPMFTNALKRRVYNGPFGPRMSIAQHMSEYLYDLLGYLHRNFAVATRVVYEPEFGIEITAMEVAQADAACAYMDAIVKMWSAA